MKCNQKILAGAFFICIGLMSSIAWTTPPEPPKIFDVRIEAVSAYTSNSPVTFRLHYSLIEEFRGLGYTAEEARIDISLLFFISFNTTDTLASLSWTDSFNDNNENVHEFDLSIPDDGVFYLLVDGKCGRLTIRGGCFVATIGDMLQITDRQRDIKGLPERKERKHKDPHNPKCEDFTPEQRQMVFKCVVDLSDSTKRAFVESLVGSVPDSNVYDNKRQTYFIETTLENVCKIVMQGIGIDYYSPRPRWEYNADKDEYEFTPIIKDTASGSQSLAPPQVMRQQWLPGFSIDSVSSLTSNGKLPTGKEITFIMCT